MLIDFILVIAGIVVFMIPAILQKERRSQFKNDFLRYFSRLAVLSGLFVSVVELVILISDFEDRIQKADVKSIISSSTELFLLIFVRLRPALVGILLKLIMIPFTKKKNNNAKNQNTQEDLFAILSPREKEVARLAARGYSNAQIAEELFISVETVKRHMATIFEKLGIESRTQLH